MKNVTRFEPQTTILDENVDVQKRLNDLRTWEKEVEDRDFLLSARNDELEKEKASLSDKRAIRIIEQKQAQISALRSRYRVLIVRSPYELSLSVLERVGYAAIHQNLISQYASLSKADRKLWLNNLYFIFTPDIRKVCDKLAKIRQSTDAGEQRNLLVGGISGSGKTRFFDWYFAHNMPAVAEERNVVTVIQVEAVQDDKTTKSILQQAVLACGANYVDDDSVSHLLNKVASNFQNCDVRVMMIDELNHLVTPTQKRRVLEISNRARSTSIVGAAVNPLKFRENSPEIQGRFIDYVQLTVYVDDKLSELLSFIELLLPFSNPSHLHKHTLELREGNKVSQVAGPCAFIQEKTKGSFRYIMRLIKDAAEIAIDRDQSHISLELLEETWEGIQTTDPDKG